MKIATSLFTVLTVLLSGNPGFPQPRPGDVFREYLWYNETGDCYGALRVGGKFDYRGRDDTWQYAGKGKIKPDFDIDLKNVEKAELVIEKMLCHSGTTGLNVVINDSEPVFIPESEGIPSPQQDYAHHFNQVTPIDLSLLKQGKDNTFSFHIDTTSADWPQNLIYGMIVRIYYKDKVIKNRGRITQPSSGAVIGLSTRIQVQFPDESEIRHVDIIGKYYDVDLEGDGRYNKWHYGFHKGKIFNHVGSDDTPPFDLNWKTDWLPDQQNKMIIAARVLRKDGLMYITEAVNDLTLNRPGMSVELCQPSGQPDHWFTRMGAFGENFRINGDVSQLTDARLVFKSWSPGYFNGIYINDFLVFIKEGPRYDYYTHDIPVNDLFVFEAGDNNLKTGKTPKYHGEMVHGVEIQWPGIMVLLKYDLSEGTKTQNNPHHK